MKDMKVFDDYEVKELDGQAKVCLNALRVVLLRTGKYVNL